ncbi:hypothetical protein [Hymenobacter crusticola]|uniref:Uncharacterized protein n=1 Tax=Hymenobacter crusticola TaxID=1770526 RepID=A0A243W6S1_9BACT|nr:hypothetical protein [Hymenobacter crusticola]OUJ70216.1 hypothetical protein BXP70_24960 [Hymenobacter crusticola]
MAELTNPLFEDQKEFLERQKLEYERALLGDVDHIKEKTQEIGKKALIGAGVIGGIWLLAKAFGGKKSLKHKDEESTIHRLKEKSKRNRPIRHSTEADTSLSDDFGFGANNSAYRGYSGRGHERAHIAPDVYHTDADPFPPLPYDDARRLPTSSFNQKSYSSAAPEDDSPSFLASTFSAFLQSDTGKMLMAQVTAVLMAYVAQKVGDYLPILKNSDLASSAPHATAEPETTDIEFTFHDDADAPHQSS